MKRCLTKEFIKFEIRRYPLTKLQLDNFETKKLNTAILDHHIRIIEAIECALSEITRRTTNGIDRVHLIKSYFWDKKHLTLDGIAIENNVHYNTAWKWVAEFVMIVGEHLGLCDN